MKIYERLSEKLKAVNNAGFKLAEQLKKDRELRISESKKMLVLTQKLNK